MMKEPVEALFPRFSRPVYRFGVWSVGGLIRRAYRIEVEGIGSVPATGPTIVAANHVSHLDPLSITSVIGRRITYLAKAEYWDSRFIGPLFTIAGQIPVERTSSEAASSVVGGMRVLGNGGVLGVHPEGTRSPDGRLYRGRTGTARLAAASGAPVIPVGVLGTYAVYPKHATRPKLRGRITVRFGSPIYWPQRTNATAATLRAFTEELMSAIASLSGQEYCDTYSDGYVRRSSAPR